MLCLNLLSHCKSRGALVKSLVRSDSHFNLISDSQQQQASFGFIEANLSDDLIKTLRKQLLTHWADTALTSLSLHELLIQHFPEASNVDS